MYERTTHGITVKVTPSFVPERSTPDEGRWLFAYRIEIDNGSSMSVRLVRRYWHITDGEGRVQEVRGAGVVGEQPVLSPGDSYTYSSACPLPTPSGIMKGAYEMECEDGTTVEVAIPAFSLDAPTAGRTLN